MTLDEDRRPFAGALTREDLLAALYCCGPTGLNQLVEHLHMRGSTFEARDLQRELSALAAEGKIYTKTLPLFGGVELVSRPGYGL
jgi:hypothetical protein